MTRLRLRDSDLPEGHTSKSVYSWIHTLVVGVEVPVLSALTGCPAGLGRGHQLVLIDCISLPLVSAFVFPYISNVNFRHPCLVESSLLTTVLCFMAKDSW